MTLRLKRGIDPDVLRKIGFAKGSEHFNKERWCGDGTGYAYQAEWYHKFLRIDWDTGIEGENGDIAYVEDCDVPMVHITFRIGDGDDLYIDCAPSCTYHIGGSELDIVTDTLYHLIKSDMIEQFNPEVDT